MRFNPPESFILLLSWIAHAPKALAELGPLARTSAGTGVPALWVGCPHQAVLATACCPDWARLLECVGPIKGRATRGRGQLCGAWGRVVFASAEEAWRLWGVEATWGHLWHDIKCIADGYQRSNLAGLKQARNAVGPALCCAPRAMRRVLRAGCSVGRP